MRVGEKTAYLPSLPLKPRPKAPVRRPGKPPAYTPPPPLLLRGYLIDRYA